jgi:hypothetical protein
MLWLASALIVAATVLFLQVRNLRSSSTLSAIFVAIGLMGFLVTSGFGHEQLGRHGFEPDPADWLVTSLSLLVISAALLAWRNRRSWWYPLIQEARAAQRHGPIPVPANGLPPPSSSSTQDSQDVENTPHSRPLASQPWKVAGWLVVVLLTLVLLVPVLGTIAILIPAYLAHQSQQDMRNWQATMATLTITFDEDLPIADIQIDGASSGPIEISPLERAVSAGPHTITVVYAHGERKRSVREKVELKQNEKRTLDVTPLVVGDMETRKKTKEQASPASSDTEDSTN